MPYKPPGNKAYPEPVKERFRPFVLELLTRFWQGSQIITLGTEAFRWFEPYVDRAEFQAIGTSDAPVRRRRSTAGCRDPAEDGLGRGGQDSAGSARCPTRRPSTAAGSRSSRR